MLVLEELEHAQARGAKIYAELIGYGISADASHMTEPDPTGESPARAMTMAIADAGVDPTEVGYVNAHATSTPLGDSAETKRDQDRARRGARATKHADLVDEGRDRATASARPARSRRCSRCSPCATASLPPTINYESPDPDCDLDYIPNDAREVPDLRSRSRTRSASAATTRRS